MELAKTNSTITGARSYYKIEVYLGIEFFQILK